MKNFFPYIDKHFKKFIFIFNLACMLLILFQCRREGLLPLPIKGMDQLSMLQAAIRLTQGHIPDVDYKYSPIYTIFLGLLAFIAQYKLVLMRALQACISAFIPVMIYLLARNLGAKREYAQAGAFLWCFYGPGLLISLSFLRAAPLALCFICAIYFLIRAFIKKSTGRYFLAGVFFGMCILGREIFIPIVILPCFLLLFREIRKYISFRFFLIYMAGILLIIMPILLYNFHRVDSFAVIPGNFSNVFGACHGKNAVKDFDTMVYVIIRNLFSQIYNLICSYEIPNSLSFYAHRDIVPSLWIFSVPFNLILILAGYGAMSAIKNKAVLLCGIIVILYSSIFLVFIILYRFRIPMVPILAALSAVGIEKIVYLFKTKQYGQAVISIAICVILFIITYDSPDNRRPHREMRAVLTILINNGHFYQAEKYIDNLHKHGILCPGQEILLIKSLAAHKKREWALELYKKWICSHNSLLKNRKNGGKR